MTSIYKGNKIYRGNKIFYEDNKSWFKTVNLLKTINLLKITTMRSFFQPIKAYFLFSLFWCLPLFAHKPLTVNDNIIVKHEGTSIIDHEFSLKYKNLVTFRDNLPLFVLPNEKIQFEILFPFPQDTYTVLDKNTNKKIHITSDYTYTSPNSGHTILQFKSKKTAHIININVFVKTPISALKNGKMQQYVIGDYPKDSSKRYVKPDGFIKVTAKNKHFKLSSHFSIGEFPSKQSNNYPKYVYIKESLILKLEKLRSLFIEDGINADRIVVMSGYRTPYYNKKIGNVKFSRHVFGDAADIFIDNNKDYRMDDINNDGKSDYADAQLLAKHIDSYASKEWYKPFIGGLGVYGAKPHRGPFLHVDTRGIRARWYKP